MAYIEKKNMAFVGVGVAIKSTNFLSNLDIVSAVYVIKSLS